MSLTNCPEPASPRAKPSSQSPGYPQTPRATQQPKRLGRWAASWVGLFDPRQPEAFLAFCSAWCAFQMWMWPQEFDAANNLMIRQIGLFGHERAWAAVGMIAALLKLAGLASRMSTRRTGWALGLRAAGLFLSIIFWLIVGVSTMIDLPHSLLPVALTGLAMAAAFELAEYRDPRETWK